MKRWYEKSQYIALYVVSLFLIGTASLIDPTSGINFTALRSLSWYVEHLLTIFAVITTVMATVYMVIDKFKEENAEYKAHSEEIKTFASGEYVPSWFSKYAQHTNKQRKKLQFEFDMRKKLFELESKVKDEDLIVWNTKDKEKMEQNAYCIKRMYYEERIQPKWIDQNIDNVSCEFDMVTAGVILGGVYSKNEDVSPNDFITKNTETKVARDKAPSLLATLALSSMVGSIAINFIFNDTTLLNIIVKILVLLFNTYNAFNYANDWTMKITLKDIRFRRAVIFEYKTWLEQQKLLIKQEATNDGRIKQ
jgi:hypothetical protein